MKHPHEYIIVGPHYLVARGWHRFIHGAIGAVGLLAGTLAVYALATVSFALLVVSLAVLIDLGAGYFIGAGYRDVS